MKNLKCFFEYPYFSSKMLDIDEVFEIMQKDLHAKMALYREEGRLGAVDAINCELEKIRFQ